MMRDGDRAARGHVRQPDGPRPESAPSTRHVGPRQLGYHSFWTAETTGPEAFSLLAAAGAAAPVLGLGTGVLALQLRTPMVVAMGARHPAGAAPRTATC